MIEQTKIADARAFINEAIEAISLEMYRGIDAESMQRVDGPECTIVVELERVDSAIGPRGSSMFGALAENVRQCAVALYAAREALTEHKP